MLEHTLQGELIAADSHSALINYHGHLISSRAVPVNEYTQLVTSRVPAALQAWRTDLEAKGKSKVANLLGDPTRGQDAELFQEGWQESLQKEEKIYGKNTNGLMDVGPILGGESP